MRENFYRITMKKATEPKFFGFSWIKMINLDGREKKKIKRT